MAAYPKFLNSIYRTHRPLGIKDYIIKTMYNIIFEKKQKIQDFIGKTNIFFGLLPFSPWTILATWLNLGTLQKLQEK
jgi:hypothetical protein